jgi:cytochrome P450
MSSADPQGTQAFPEELMSRETWLEPFDWYHEMREENPVRYDPKRKTWDVFQYDDVKSILADDETFSTDPRNAPGFQEPEGEEQGLILETMLLQDPPRHDELRSVVDEAFQPRTLRDLEPRIRELTTDLLNEALSADPNEMEIVNELAYPLPVIVIAELLGVPADEREQFKAWSDTLVAAANTENPEEHIESQQEAQREMAMYFMEMITDRRENPQNDLMSHIVTTETDNGSQLSHQEALGMCILLLIAGNITTTNLITNAVRCFANHDLRDDLVDGERSLSNAIEEVLRYRSPVQAMTRFAMTDVTMQGETIETGERIAVWLGSANRDERQFDAADSFIHDRTPNQHLGFGYGTHYCLGAPLARLEAKVVLSELLTRLDSIEISDTTLQPTRSSFIYGVESLPIKLEAGT